MKKTVSLYTCGPTVYDFQHIGNFRTFIFGDILKRVIVYNGYKIKHVMNITDVGHLTGDRDMGEDKLAKEAKEKKKSAWDIAKFYTKVFLEDSDKLNIIRAAKIAKATDYIKDQIKLVKLLEKGGYTYTTSDGVYFDTSKLKDYGKLANLKLEELQEGARVEKNPEKRNSTDFALWKFAKEEEKRDMEWKSPWGEHSFPGWHIECSAISTKFLGQPFDIHTGGIEHIPVHHTNEIAQSEAAYKKPLANYWLHAEHLKVDGHKMAKSLKNFYTIGDLEKRGFDPLAFRYLTFSAHYKAPLNFTWDALEAASNTLNNLYHDIALLGFLEQKKTSNNRQTREYEKKFMEAIDDDLNMPRAISIVWDLLKDESISNKEKRKIIFKFDKVLGLDLKKADEFKKAPAKIKALAEARERLRVNKQFTQADALRKEIEALGYTLEDTEVGPFLWRKKM